MSKEVLILTIVGTAIIITVVLTTTVRTTSVFDEMLSVLSPLSIA
jgi:hypothetical protein